MYKIQCRTKNHINPYVDIYLLPLYKLRPVIRLCTEYLAQIDHHMAKHISHPLR